MAVVLEQPSEGDKPKDEAGTSRPARPNKKGKDKRRHDDNMVAAVDPTRKASKPSRDQPKDHFERLLESPCTNHEGPVRHLLKDCNLMKRFLGGKQVVGGTPMRTTGRPPDGKRTSIPRRTAQS